MEGHLLNCYVNFLVLEGRGPELVPSFLQGLQQAHEARSCARVRSTGSPWSSWAAIALSSARLFLLRSLSFCCQCSTLSLACGMQSSCSQLYIMACAQNSRGLASSSPSLVFLQNSLRLRNSLYLRSFLAWSAVLTT